MFESLFPSQEIAPSPHGPVHYWRLISFGFNNSSLQRSFYPLNKLKQKIL